MAHSRIALALFAIAFASTAAAQVDWQNPNAVAAAAVSSSPAMARLQSEVSAARERAVGAGSQPNPMLMGGIRDKKVDLADDEMMTMYMVGASQTFVRPAKREAAKSFATLGIQSVEQQLAATKAETERDALFGWYDVASVDTQIAAAEQVRQLLEAITEAARIRYEVGGAAQADVIRAQLQRAEIDNQILTLRGARANAVARLLPLLGLPANTTVPRLTLHTSTGALELEGPVAVPDDHPALAAARAEVAQREEQIRAARLLSKPDVDLEFSYGVRRMQTDMFTVQAKIELPLRRGTLIEPRIREAVALRDAAQRRIEEIRRIIERGLAVAAAAHEQANTQLALEEQVLLPQAKLAFDSTLAAYQSGRSNFDAVLGAETTYLRLQLDHVNHFAEHIKAITDFQALRNGARAGALGGASMSTPTTPASTSATSSSMSSM